MLVLLAAACRPSPVDLGDSSTSVAVVHTTPTVPRPPPQGEPALVFTGARPTNLLMLSIDTTRRDHFGSYGVDGTNYTPFLDGLASAGVTLEDHQQCSNWTYHSTSCTLNGRYAEEDGFIPQLSATEQLPLPDGQLTLARRLSLRGYHTILLSTNGWLSTRWNNAQGYDDAPEVFTSVASVLMQEGVDRVREAVSAGESTWMLHLHFIEPHPPYNPPPEYLTEEQALDPLPDNVDLASQLGQYAATDQWPDLTEAERDLLEAHLRARYHGELRYLDDQLAAFWPTFEAAGMLDDTLVVVWTDHGEQFWEHGDQAHAFYIGAEENDAVAFFWANGLPAQRWTAPTHAVDLAPTVLDALGYPPDPQDSWFSGYILGTAPAGRPRYISSLARLGPLEGVTVDGWKLTFNFSGAVRLWDRNTDRYETEDVYAQNPDDPHVLPLWNLLLPRIAMMDALAPNTSVVYPEDLPHP